MQPQTFRKKPVEIQALRWDGDNHEQVKAWLGDDYVALSSKHNPRGGSKIMIRTLEGTIYAEIGDWLIRGIQGEHYPCKPDIFAATYEAVGGVLAAADLYVPGPVPQGPVA